MKFAYAVAGLLVVAISLDVASAEDCKVDEQGLEYAGDISVTASGEDCVDWPSDFELEGNYCRNLYTDTGPWCWTQSGWGYCDIPLCAPFECSDATKNRYGTELCKKLTADYGAALCTENEDFREVCCGWCHGCQDRLPQLTCMSQKAANPGICEFGEFKEVCCETCNCKNKRAGCETDAYHCLGDDVFRDECCETCSCVDEIDTCGLLVAQRGVTCEDDAQFATQCCVSCLKHVEQAKNAPAEECLNRAGEDYCTGFITFQGAENCQNPVFKRDCCTLCGAYGYN